MGFFKDFKDDLSETANEVNKVAEEETATTVEPSEDEMVNTLDADTPDLSGLSASLTKELEQTEEVKADEAETVEEEEVVIDDSDAIADETAIITAGLSVNGDLTSIGSIDVLGSVTGNVICRGKLTVSGSICGDSNANEIFANNAQIEGNVEAKGSIKVGNGTVIVGDIVATSAVIAGAVKGNIDVHGPVIVDSTAVIVGDIKSKSVQINNGAAIDGRCSQCYADVDTAAIFDIKTKKKK